MASAWRAAVATFRGLFGKPQADAEFRDEVRDHLALLTERYIRQGMPPGDAAQAARRQFGNILHLQEDHREMRSLPILETIGRDLRYGARQLRLSPLFTTVAVLSLALGIGANTAIFELVNAVRLRSLPVEKPEELGYIDFQKGNSRSGNWDSRSANLTYTLYQQLRAQQHAFRDVTAWSAHRFNLAAGGEIRWAEGLYVSGNFFRLLGVEPVLGRGFADSDDASSCASPGAVISYGFWQHEFAGQPDVLGRNVTLEGRPFPVVGVMPASFSGVEVGNRYDVAIPLCADRLMAEDGKGRMPNMRAWWLSAMGRLKPGWDVARASRDFQMLSPGVMQASLSPSYRPDDAKAYLKNKLEVVPGATGVSNLRTTYEQPLWLLLATAAMVLLIACVNLANLMLARASVREREIAVRQAIGASRGRLVAQLMSESLLLAGLGAALGVLLSQVLSRGLVAFLSSADSGLFLGLGLDGRVLGFTAAISLGTCLFFGLAPALRATRVSPSSAMRTGGRGLTAGRERFGFRRALVVAQMSLSLVLVGALLFISSLRNLLTLDPGFRSDGIVAMDIDFARAHYPKQRRPAVVREVAEHLRAIPGMTSVAQVFITPVSGSQWNDACWAEGDPGKHKVANFNRVSPGYFQTMATPLVAGRDFNEGDSVGSPAAAIVNEAFTKKIMGGGNPVGRAFLVEGEAGESDARFQVVGVVRNTKYGQIREDFVPIAYLAVAQDKDPGPSATLVMRSALPVGQVFRAAKAAAAGVSGSMEVQLTALTKQLQDSLLRDRLMATLAGAFGLLAGLLATLGLYGIVSYMVARRRNEIGIRVALGAGRIGVVWLVLREVAVLLVCGLGIGAGLALWAGKAAGSLLFGLKANDFSTMAGAMLLLALVAVAASYGPARRAAAVEPMQALREE